jgi:hypothetical protein
VLDFLSRAGHPALAALGTSCPDHFLRTKVRPMLLDLPPEASAEAAAGRLRELHEAYREDYRAYYERYADAFSPPMRGADAAIVLVPGVGMFSFGADAQTARVAGEFYLNAITVMRGAEAVSAYQPIPEREKFRIEYWELGEAKLRRRLQGSKPRPLAGRIALVTGGGSGIGRATARRLAAEGACVVVADRDGGPARVVADELGSRDVATAVTADVADEDAVAAAFDAAALAYGGVDLVVNNAGLSISKPLLETSLAGRLLRHHAARGTSVRERAGDCGRHAVLGHSPASRRRAGTACGRQQASSRWPAWASTPGEWTTDCSTGPARYSATRCTIATRAPKGWRTGCWRR